MEMRKKNSQEEKSCISRRWSTPMINDLIVFVSLFSSSSSAFLRFIIFQFPQEIFFAIMKASGEKKEKIIRDFFLFVVILGRAFGMFYDIRTQPAV